MIFFQCCYEGVYDGQNKPWAEPIGPKCSSVEEARLHGATCHKHPEGFPYQYMSICRYTDDTGLVRYLEEVARIF